MLERLAESRFRNEEGSLPPDKGSALTLLDYLIASHPWRSKAVDVLRDGLHHSGRDPQYERVYGWSDLYHLTERFCLEGKQLARQGNYYHLFSFDGAIFIIVHPRQAAGSWISVGHHNYTGHKEGQPWLVVKPERLTNLFGRLGPDCVKFYLAAFDPMATFEAVKGVIICDLVSGPFTMKLGDQVIQPTDPQSLERPWDPAVFVEIGRNGLWKRGWQVYAVPSKIDGRQLLLSEPSLPND